MNKKTCATRCLTWIEICFDHVQHPLEPQTQPPFWGTFIETRTPEPLSPSGSSTSSYETAHSNLNSPARVTTHVEPHTPPQTSPQIIFTGFPHQLQTGWGIGSPERWPEQAPLHSLAGSQTHQVQEFFPQSQAMTGAIPQPTPFAQPQAQAFPRFEIRVGQNGWVHPKFDHSRQVFIVANEAHPTVNYAATPHNYSQVKGSPYEGLFLVLGFI